MSMIRHSVPKGLREEVRKIRDLPDFLFELQAILHRASQHVESLGMTCNQCGECCDFATAGHQLFVSTGELALLTSTRPSQPLQPERCCYQIDNACLARDDRALGCRLHFCNPSTRSVFQPLYEQFHTEIVEIHRKWSISYYYTELCAALAAVFAEA